MTPTPHEFHNLSPRDQFLACLRLGFALDAGRVTLSKQHGRWLVHDRSLGTMTLARWAYAAQVRAALRQEVAAWR